MYHRADNREYLSVNVISASHFNTFLTFLTSRHNGLVTVYDISRPPEGFIHLNNLPYLVSGNTDMYQRHIGQRFLFHNETLGLVRLSEQKGVEFTEILPSPTKPHMGHTIELSEDVIKWRDTHVDIPADIGTLGVQEFSQVDLNSAYKGSVKFIVPDIFLKFAW